MVLNQPGKGRSVYFAEDIGPGVFHRALPVSAKADQQRRALGCRRRTSRRFRSKRPSACKRRSTLRTTGSGRSCTCSTRSTPRANRAIPENNPSQREETLPIVDIKVTLAGTEVTTAFQEPGHLPLTIKKTAHGLEVTVPRLEVHSMVVFE